MPKLPGAALTVPQATASTSPTLTVGLTANLRLLVHPNVGSRLAWLEIRSAADWGPEYEWKGEALNHYHRCWGHAASISRDG